MSTQTVNAYTVEGPGAWLHYGPGINARWARLGVIERLLREAIMSPDEAAAWTPKEAAPIVVPLAILESASQAIREATP